MTQRPRRHRQTEIANQFPTFTGQFGKNPERKGKTMSYETPWRSLGETAVNFRNADKSEGNRITCSLIDTTGVYHRQSSGAVERN
jgi:hypothetical protein